MKTSSSEMPQLRLRDVENSIMHATTAREFITDLNLGRLGRNNSLESRRFQQIRRLQDVGIIHVQSSKRIAV